MRPSTNGPVDLSTNSTYLFLIIMIVFDTQTILLATVGMIGIMGAFTVLAYSLIRNRTGKGDYQ